MPYRVPRPNAHCQHLDGHLPEAVDLQRPLHHQRVGHHVDRRVAQLPRSRWKLRDAVVLVRLHGTHMWMFLSGWDPPRAVQTGLGQCCGRAPWGGPMLVLTVTNHPSALQLLP